MDLPEFLAAVAQREGANKGILSWEEERDAALRFEISARELQGAALGAGLRLERYARNFSTIDGAGQALLHSASVAIIGCGGLGGHVIEELARLGVGRLVVVDSDCFEPSNLNRQILATLSTLGRPKVEVAAERVAAINPATLVEPHLLRFDPGTAETLLRGVQVVADALDSIPSRFILARACAQRGLPLVHAGIAGWYAQATCILPGSGSLEAIYGETGGDTGIIKGIETQLGNPAFTPAVAASIEVAEICKILLGRAASLAGSFLHLDLGRMEMTKFPLD